MELKKYLESKGIKAVAQGNNLVFNCPLCDDQKQRMGINVNPHHAHFENWNCYNCEKRGRTLQGFQRELNKVLEESDDTKIAAPSGEDSKEFKKKVKIKQELALKYHRNLKKEKRKANDYLRDVRGFSKDTIEHFMLGSWLTKGYEYASIPFWEDGQLVNIKFRAVSNKVDKKFKWRRITGGKSSLFHDEVLSDLELKEIIITEAELDAIAIYNAGIKNVVSITTGAKGFAQEWYEKLHRFDRIYLCMDNDIDGQDGAERIARRLGMDKCYILQLPKEKIIEDGKETTIKDANQYFWDRDKKQARHTKKDFKKLLESAKQIEVKGIISLREAYRELVRLKKTGNEDELFGLLTPWPKVNAIMGGQKPGFLVVVTAPSKTGKTTWVLDWMLGLGKQKIPSYIECCEMRQLRIAEKTIASACPDYAGTENITELQIREAAYHNPSDYVYLGYPIGVPDLEKTCDKIKEAVQRYGIQLVCFDNLHFLVRGDNVKDKIGEVTRRFKLLAEELGIIFVLITHPRRLPNPNKSPTPDDLKDSSSIFQDLDTLVILHRKPKDNGDAVHDSAIEISKGKLDPMTEVNVHSRWGEGGSTMLYFNGARAKFLDDGPTYRKSIIEYRNSKKKVVNEKNKTYGNRR